MTNQPLPDGWRWGRLGEECKVDRRQVRPRTPEAAVLPYVGLEHIESETGRTLSTNAADEEVLNMTSAFDMRHVLYGKLRPYLNKLALPDSAGRCTTELIPLLPRENCDREFLA